MSRILIVDDEESIRRSLAGILSDEGFETQAVASGETALRALAAPEEGDLPDLVLLDIAMPGRDGIDTLAQLRRDHPELPVVMMSGYGTIETALKATRLGAFDFVEKPVPFDRLLLTITHALEEVRLLRENTRLRAAAYRAHEILGSSEAIRKLKQQIEQAAPTNGWVLLTGESGTGKELFARQIHIRSKRADKPFVEVNSAAIPEELIESELFGHEKGAFTGAIAQRRGKFELGDGGTLFLDEIADMSLKTQAKVLRILQEHAFERVGGTESIEVDVRVIAATNKSLEEEIAQGRFREDLYYRLNVIPFRVPALRERREDIPIMAKAFAAEFCAEAGLAAKEITPRAMARLRSYSWPGNVRELRNIIERLVLMTPSQKIDVEDLPELTREPPRREEPALLKEAVQRFERDLLVARLRENEWNISITAKALGIARESLSRKLKAHRIKSEAKPPRD